MDIEYIDRTAYDHSAVAFYQSCVCVRLYHYARRS